MLNQFSKNSIAIALAALFSVTTVNAADDPFAELDAEVATLNQPHSKKIAEFHAYVNQYLDEYEAWRDAYTQELDKRKSELISEWGEGDVSSNTTSVQYSEDGTVRTTIDYEKGTMEVSVLTGEKDILENALKIAQANVKTENNIAFNFDGAQVSQSQVEYTKVQELTERKFILDQTEAQMNEIDVQAERLIRTNTGIPADFIYERAYNKKQNLLKQAQERLNKLSELYNSRRTEYKFVASQAFTEEEKEIVDKKAEDQAKKPEVQASKEKDVTANKNEDKKAVVSKTEPKEPEKKKPVVTKKTPKKVVNYKVKLPKNTLTSRAEKYQPYAEQESKRFNIDAPLVMAIMHSESAFRPKAKSFVPAYGLMQVVPSTAGHDVNKQIRNINKPMTPDELYQAPINVETGTAYLHILNHKYLKYIKNDESRLYCTIAAYNTGAGNVAKAFNANHSTNIKKASKVINQMTPKQVYDKLMKDLPYGETKNYLKKVNGRIALYK